MKPYSLNEIPCAHSQHKVKAQKQRTPVITLLPACIADSFATIYPASLNSHIKGFHSPAAITPGSECCTTPRNGIA